jgi:hypothetical protein
VKRSVSFHLGSLALQALAGEKEEKEVGGPMPSRVVRAIRCYLNDKGSGSPSWRYPSFLAEQERDGGGGEMRVSIDEGLWHSLEREAVSQGISPQRMVEHAAFYFAAEVDAGRITQRILADLDGADAEASSR